MRETKWGKNGVSRRTSLALYLEGRHTFSTKTGFAVLSTTISFNPRSILMRPWSFSKVFETNSYLTSTFSMEFIHILYDVMWCCIIISCSYIVHVVSIDWTSISISIKNRVNFMCWSLLWYIISYLLKKIYFFSLVSYFGFSPVDVRELKLNLVNF